MNRRGFLQRLCSGAVATAVAVHLPLHLLPQAVRREGAIKFLRDAYNGYMKGKGVRYCPDIMYAGGDLFEAYRLEIIVNQRETNNLFAGPWVSPVEPREHLMFKGARLIRASESGWWVDIEVKQ